MTTFRPRRALFLLFVFALAGIAASASVALAQKAPPLAPKRLSSIGDSMTEAIDAELPFANHWASWANGYSSFWTRIFGLTNVNSHNQRIDSRFGRSGRRNYIEAKSGADSYDLAQQSAQAVSHQASYVTLLMGHNDVCQNNFAQIPTDAEFEANVRGAFETLRTGLPDGAVIYSQALVDIFKLYELGDELDALGLIACPVVWATTLINLFPCGTMLSPLNSDADRAFTRSRNIAFNDILASLVTEYETNDPDHHWRFTDVTFDYDFVASDVSGIDCFHPSASGQRTLSALTWADGPFGN